MKIYIVGEYREQFPSKLKERNFNPHPSYSCITDIQKACEEKGLDCIYYGGVYELIHAIDSKEHFDSDVLFFNISDGLTQSYCRIQAPVLLELMGVKYTGSSPFLLTVRVSWSFILKSCVSSPDLLYLHRLSMNVLNSSILRMTP